MGIAVNQELVQHLTVIHVIIYRVQINPGGR